MIKADPKLKPKKCRVKFTPYGTKIGLPMIGRTKAILTCVAGNSINTIVYIVKGAKQSLLGRFDAQNLGIVRIYPKGDGEISAQRNVELMDQPNNTLKNDSRGEESLLLSKEEHSTPSLSEEQSTNVFSSKE